MGVLTLPRGLDNAAQHRAIEKRKCEISLAEFVKAGWHIIEPSQTYLHNWHVDLVAAHLEAIAEGVQFEDDTYYNRLLINVPPGTMKSLLVGVFFPAWVWGPYGHPERRFLSVTHSQDLTERDTNNTRVLILSEWYQGHWGDKVKITRSKFDMLENSKRGFRQSATWSNVTGKRAHHVLIDDPHSVKTAESDAERTTTVRLFREAIPSRLVDPIKSSITVVMQRLHEADVSGTILEGVMGYDHICLPMRYDPERAKETMLGYQDPRTEEGELLFPLRFPQHVVDRDEAALGPYACNPGEAPVLMGDLSLKRVDQVKAGDEVMGWTREPGGRAKMIRTVVKSPYKYSGEVVRMTLDSGEVIRCTPDHKWWTGRYDRELYAPVKVGGSLARVCQPSFPQLSPEEERMAGWLCGFFEGDGSVSNCKKSGSGAYTDSKQIHFYQGAGRNLPICEKLEAALKNFGFEYSYSEDERKPNKDAPCYGYRNYTLTNGQHSLGLGQGFLHIVKPTKWADRLSDMALGAKFIKQWEKVVSIEPEGVEPVYALETGTGNYVIWGIASSNTAGQFAQNPEPRGGSIIKDSWWKLWDRNEYPSVSTVVASLDTAYTIKTENDPSAMSVFGVFDGALNEDNITRLTDRYGNMIKDEAPIYRSDDIHEVSKTVMMYAWTERLELHDLVKKVVETCRMMKVDYLLIENKAAGHSVAQELRRLFANEDFAVIMYDPKTADKTARLYSVQHLFSEGMVYAPAKSWAETVIRQTSVFPRGKHDDLVDTVSMCLQYIRNMGMLIRAPERLAQIDRDKTHIGGGLAPLYGGN